MMQLSYRHIKVVLAALIVLMCMYSCKKFVTIPPPGGRVVTETAFANDSLAMETVTGIYIQAMNTNLTLLNGMGVYLGLSADELTEPVINSNDNQFLANDLLPNNTIITNNCWKSGYALVYHINACLEQLSNSQKVSPALRTRLMAESQFMRALTYFNLVNLFGNIPLVTGTSMDNNMNIGQSPADTVYKLIVSDLQSAYAQLPDTGSNSRPTR